MLCLKFGWLFTFLLYRIAIRLQPGVLLCRFRLPIACKETILLRFYRNAVDLLRLNRCCDWLLCITSLVFYPFFSKRRLYNLSLVLTTIITYSAKNLDRLTFKILFFTLFRSLLYKWAILVCNSLFINLAKYLLKKFAHTGSNHSFILLLKRMVTAFFTVVPIKGKKFVNSNRRLRNASLLLKLGKVCGYSYKRGFNFYYFCYILKCYN
ncbi:hypothetical protein GGTG_04808 [Gaeumannomyces tritici R3-111a-1]|uniref:Uncharacterized protein n=1 Tax=Gaeumannomyces tritici (strain R3-111a-1) TaxID=644352 RepID=J3NU53_GAET3|nr:hypothetical protein GGTG_04808 [Gaeumannomyces tritici R3-111a-1]EJT79724.1 hypothetical protein GGTG_04808 [Gaeumannomyces tritici R3-111a-1]